MRLHDLKPAPGSKFAKTRKGRGEAAGKGKTAGRGTKGTGARKNVPLGFEGGQIPLQRRLPKLPGFKPHNRIEYQSVNIGTLDKYFENGDVVTAEALTTYGVLNNVKEPFKILGDGELTKKLTVHAAKISGSARAKIEELGGTIQAPQA